RRPSSRLAPSPPYTPLSRPSITTGDTHTCGITTTGTAYCWGNNGSGRLGNGNTGGSYNTPQAVSGGLTFASITAGLGHTCGLTADRDGTRRDSSPANRSGAG